METKDELFNPKSGIANPKKKMLASGLVSRVLCRELPRATAIYLAARLPWRSSGLPGSRVGPDRSCSHIWPCFRWGLPSQPVARLLVRSYIKARRPAPFHPCLGRSQSAVCFLWHFPGPCGRWALPITVSCEARTFLPSAAVSRPEERPSSSLASIVNYRTLRSWERFGVRHYFVRAG